MSVLSEKILNLPSVPGVYLFKGGSGRVLYVGKAIRLSERLRSYLHGTDTRPMIPDLMAEAVDLDVIMTGSDAEALLLESTLVRQHRPHFNILLKDDKSFPYVRVSVQEEFPRVSVTRQVKPDGARYLGPYVDVGNLRRTLRELRRVFPVRTCRNFEDYRRRNRPCLYFHIKRCAGPCTTRSALTPPEYRALVDGLLLFLTGRDEELLVRLRAEMAEAATSRDYEGAARRRDQIHLLESARTPQNVVVPNARDADVLGIARHGSRASIVTLRVRDGRVVGKESRVLAGVAGAPDEELLRSFMVQHYLARSDAPGRIVTAREPADREALLESLQRANARTVALVTPTRGRERRLVELAERNAAHALEDLDARASGRRARFAPGVLDLQKALGLSVPPYRMVCFDISNLGAEHAVAAVVAGENGTPRRSLYRRMRMRRPGPDDFAMMREAVSRYWARVESGELPRPDLVVVDGGEGQLSAARSALDEITTRPVAAIGLAKREETIVREGAPAITLPRRSPSLRMLQQLRDEAHRFGLTYHRMLRARSRLTGALDRIPGVGPARRAALLKAFGSVAALRGADADAIAREARVSTVLAERIVTALRETPGERTPARRLGDQ
ncbi:MAG: excinuclease ABC subunit UvrC, partial [Candidatus Eisenbacteria bacterium]|nr:excinuclease ABC subunit UvrC [Candidatus Eisenbacteria bacterium]